jgi:hypothetical protein
MNFDKDPLGLAICDYSDNGFSENITVEANLCEDDIMPIEYLFRSVESMPALEQKALQLTKGKVLDVGAAAGCHSLPLLDEGLDVTAIDASLGAVTYMKTQGIPAYHQDFYTYKGQFDTVLVLMNGIGIAGSLEKLPLFLTQLKALIAPNGQALCDSTDLTYLYQEDDGSMWVDLNGSYHGEMEFRMKYKTATGEWFDWLYIDFELLKENAEKVGLNCELILEGESDNYLVRLTHQ